MTKKAHDIFGHDQIRMLVPVNDFEVRTNKNSNQQTSSLNMINKYEYTYRYTAQQTISLSRQIVAMIR